VGISTGPSSIHHGHSFRQSRFLQMRTAARTTSGLFRYCLHNEVPRQSPMVIESQAISNARLNNRSSTFNQNIGRLTIDSKSNQNVLRDVISTNTFGSKTSRPSFFHCDWHYIFLPPLDFNFAQQKGWRTN